MKALAMRPFRTAVVLGALVLGAGTARAETLAITGAEIHTAGPAGTLENATVLVRDGKIVEVGAQVRIPGDARIIDARGKQVTPGFMHSDSSLGLAELGTEAGYTDTNAMGSIFSAAFNVKYAINYSSQVVAENRRQGLTRAVANPGGSGELFQGTGAILALDNTPAMIVAEGPMLVNLRAVGNRNIGWARLRLIFDEVLDYQKNRRNVLRGNWRDGYVLTPANMEALVAVLEGNKKLMLSASGASDILQALQLKQDYGLDLIITGAEEAYLVADQIRAAEVPLIIDPQRNLPNGGDSLRATFSNAAKLEQAGVTFAIAGGGMLSGNSAYLVNQLAGMAVAHGMSWEGALRAISRNPAKIFGIDGTYGSIEVGKEADLVVWDGDPLEVTSNTEHVLVRGVEYPLVSRRSELARRYLDKAAATPYGLR